MRHTSGSKLGGLCGILLLTATAADGQRPASSDDYGYGAHAAERKAQASARRTTEPQPRSGVQPLHAPPRDTQLTPAPGGLTEAGPVPVGRTDDGIVALVGGTVHTVADGTLERATVLMADGRILAVGTDVAIPPEAHRIDVSGEHVYPSLIAADTVLGLVEISAVRATRDTTEVGDLNPNVRAEVSVNPSSTLLPVTRSNGILVAMTAPRGGLISGTAALIELDGWTWEDMTVEAPGALLVNWPSMRLNRSPTAKPPLKKQREARDGRVRKLREAFETARAYARGLDAVADGAPRQDRDVKWDSMIDAVRGDLKVLIHAPTILEIRAALDFAEQQGLDIILKTGEHALEVKEELRRKRIPVIVSTVLNVGASWQPYDVNFSLPKQLHDAGVEFCIASSAGGFAAAHTRSLPYIAAKAVAYGLPRDQALEALTLAPARMFGVDDRLGSIEPGKHATLIVTDGDPLDIRSNVHRAFIRGRALDLTDRHKRLYERYRMRPRATANAEGADR